MKQLAFPHHFLYSNMTLSTKLGMTFSKEHQTGACQFDALSREKVALPLSFS
jgi:hypothetical protein